MRFLGVGRFVSELHWGGGGRRDGDFDVLGACGVGSPHGICAGG